MSELAAYLEPAASNLDQTPRWGSLYGHEQGDFWFRTPGAVSPAVMADSSPPRFPLKGNSEELTNGSSCTYCPEMVVVPPGKVKTASKTINIERPFAVGKYEVSFSEWDACVQDGGCRHNPSDEGWGRDNRPVINVTWQDAKEYVQWLSGRTGQYYRLLTEEEWEYAARAGLTEGTFWDGSTRVEACRFANVYDNASQRKYQFKDRDWHRCNDDFAATAPVGSFQANGFGLQDVLGNVREWTEERVPRGGSWNKEPRYVNLSNRYRVETPNRGAIDIGFRVARDLE